MHAVSSELCQLIDRFVTTSCDSCDERLNKHASPTPAQGKSSNTMPESDVDPLHPDPRTKTLRGRREPIDPPMQWICGAGIDIFWPKESNPVQKEEWKNYNFDREKIKFYSHSFDSSSNKGSCEVEWNSNGVIYHTKWRVATHDRRAGAAGLKRRREAEARAEASSFGYPSSSTASTDGSNANNKKTKCNNDTRKRQKRHPSQQGTGTSSSLRSHFSSSLTDAQLLQIASDAAYAAIQRVDQEREQLQEQNQQASVSFPVSHLTNDSPVATITTTIGHNTFQQGKVIDISDDSDDESNTDSKPSGQRGSKVLDSLACAAKAAAKKAFLGESPGSNDDSESICNEIRERIADNRELWEQCKASMRKRPGAYQLNFPQGIRSIHAEDADDGDSSEECKGFMSFERRYVRIKVVEKDTGNQSCGGNLLHLEFEYSEPMDIMLRGLAKYVPSQFAEFIFPKEESGEGYILDYKISRSIWTDKSDMDPKDRIKLLRDFCEHLESINKSLLEIIAWLEKPKEWETTAKEIVEKYATVDSSGALTMERMELLNLEHSLMARKPAELKKLFNWEYDLT